MAFQRRMDEDVTKQKESLAEALKALAGTLEDLATECSLSAKVAKRGKPVDMTPVISKMAYVRRAEETYDLAKLDLETAMGEDA